MKNNNPEFIIFTGPMFSSKTTCLLSTIDRFRYQKKSIAVFKPMSDDRYAKEGVMTHRGESVDAISIEEGADLLKHLADSDSFYEVVAVDEAFMIKGISDVLIWLFKRGITIVVSSLTLSYNLQIFDEISKILPYSTTIEVRSAVCTVCGNDAHYTYRKTDENEMIVIGGKELYEPRCWEHHPSTNRREFNSSDKVGEKVD